MSTSWRMAGLNYVNYSNIAARVLRGSVKGAPKEDATKSSATVRTFYWANGEMLPEGKKLTPDKDEKKAV